VIVTGASSGIGEAAARALARRGFAVFAGVRNTEAAAALFSPDSAITPIRLDVTDAASIARAVQTIAVAGIPLCGVVNNAGIAVAGPLEYVALERLRLQFEINVVGQVAVTQAFLPLLRKSRGRVIFIGSISGRSAVPFIGPYSASKFALRALADALRMELQLCGVDVVLIEPGSVRTPIWQKGRDANIRMWDSLPKSAREDYGDTMEAMVRISEREERTGIPPERVAAVIAAALTARKPRTHYLVGTPARIGSVLASFLPARVHDRLVRKAMQLPSAKSTPWK
jgi:NAD(P)-dependent dehydrogenase (short-subunit alcohol dehydrogenase family)